METPIAHEVLRHLSQLLVYCPCTTVGLRMPATLLSLELHSPCLSASWEGTHLDPCAEVEEGPITGQPLWRCGPWEQSCLGPAKGLFPHSAQQIDAVLPQRALPVSGHTWLCCILRISLVSGSESVASRHPRCCLYPIDIFKAGIRAYSNRPNILWQGEVTVKGLCEKLLLKQIENCPCHKPIFTLVIVLLEKTVGSIK